VLDDAVRGILAARAIMLEDALDEVFIPFLHPRMSRFASGFHWISYLTALGSVVNRAR